MLGKNLPQFYPLRCTFHQHLRVRFSKEIWVPKPKRNKKSCLKGRSYEKRAQKNVDEIDGRSCEIEGLLLLASPVFIGIIYMPRILVKFRDNSIMRSSTINVSTSNYEFETN